MYSGVIVRHQHKWVSFRETAIHTLSEHIRMVEGEKITKNTNGKNLPPLYDPLPTNILRAEEVVGILRVMVNRLYSMCVECIKSNTNTPPQPITLN